MAVLLDVLWRVAVVAGSAAVILLIRNRKSKVGKTGLWVVAGLMIGLVAFGSYQEHKVLNEEMAPLFGPYFYRGAAEADRPELPAGGAKMIAFDVENQVFSYKYVPGKYKAAHDDEVGYVLTFREDHTQKGRYTDGAPAYRRVIVATIVRMPDQQLLGMRHFKGGEPPRTVAQTAKAGYGSYPSARGIQDWVLEQMNELARK